MKIAMLLSGGVDSSVALALLTEQIKKKIELNAFYIKVWLQDDFVSLGNCPWKEDIYYAKKVCNQFKIPLKIISLQKVYWDKVVSYSIRELKAGRTPNPDMLCNSMIKFGEFINLNSTYDYFATGHYAQVLVDKNQVHLKTTKDQVKDQTYFLSYLNRDQLRKCCFPIGQARLNKSEVRVFANKYKLPNKDRKDSQGVCFLGKIKYRDFIKSNLGEREGLIKNIKDNKIIGKHKGYWFHTLGQRQGLGLSSGPWYVVDKDITNNIVYVGNKEDFTNNILSNNFIKIKEINWIEKKLFTKLAEIELRRVISKYNITKKKKTNMKVKLRHGKISYFFKIVEYNIEKKNIKIKLEQEVDISLGLAPGQFAVFYYDELCLASGIISK